MPAEPEFVLVPTPLVTTVVVAGEIDLAVKDALDSTLDAAVALGAPVLVDLCSCTFMGSAAVGALVRAKQAADRAGIVFALACPPGSAPIAVLDLTVPGHFDVHPSPAVLDQFAPTATR